MSARLWLELCTLIQQDRWLVWAHAPKRLLERNINLRDIINDVLKTEVVEMYPEAVEGPSALVLTRDAEGRAIHAVRGLRRGPLEPAVLVTVYRPDPGEWSADFLRRKP